MTVNSIINILDRAGWEFSKTLWTIWLIFLYRLKGVKLGSGSHFYGFTKIKKTTDSEISIGMNCTFRSSPTSNLIGINRPCIISTLGNRAQLKVGNDCGLSGTVIGCFSEIIIGNNVKIGANVLITDSDWHQEDPRSGKPEPVHIGDNVWIGTGTVVLKGVTIGNNSLIGASSVVVHDIPDGVIAAGNPCRVIRKFPNE